MNNYIQEYLIQLLSFNKNSPIIFTGVYFWGFFTIVFAIFSVIHKKITIRNLFLFLVSIFFYYKTSGLYFTLLLFTIVSDYFIGKKLFTTENKLHRKLLVIWSVGANLSILAYFKYAYFFTDSYNQIFATNNQVWNVFAQFSNTLLNTGFDVDSILLPVGISFYTFQAISYTVDIYKRKLEPLHSLFDFGFYVSFFPQLVAGPIVRASEFIPQMYRPYTLSGYQFGLAIFMILGGLVKKMVIGDYMAVQFIDKVFANPVMFTGFENLMAVFAYSLQVYCDFSGYTDIAIGIALLMGFRFNTNFNSPYKAQNVAEFWKRWHISLSTWLRDYLYIPLGGNKKGSIVSYILFVLLVAILTMLLGLSAYWLQIVVSLVILMLLYQVFPSVRKHINTNINLMLTMLLGGLWHGSTLNFIVWGGLNGLALVFYKHWRKISPWEKLNQWYIRVFKITFTFAFISFTRIWFRAADEQTATSVREMIFYKLDFSYAGDVLLGFWKVFLVFALGMTIHWLPKELKNKVKYSFIKSPVYTKVIVVLITVLIIWQTVSADFIPFIYFQF